jgi:xylulokinase
MARLIALDVGSSALKAALYDRDQGLIATAEAAYGPDLAPHRQDPEQWWHAAQKAISSLDTSDVTALVLTGTMENLILLDEKGQSLFPALLYSDPSGAPFLDQMQPELANASAILGNTPEPLMTAFKWCWFKATEPALAARVATILPGAKDALAFRLTGQRVTDPITATTTGLMDIAKRDWSAEMLSLFGVSPAQLPTILDASAIIGPLTASASAFLELPTSIAVINGCGDAGATTIGSFCEQAGDVSLYLGTSGWVARVTPLSTLQHDRPVYRLAHPTPELLIEVTPILSAGAAAAWSRKALGLTLEDSEEILRLADAHPPDLLFLPYLSGERSPFIDTDVRGAFIGLDASHGASEMAYSVLEGVSLATRANLLSLDPSGQGAITMVGGGAKSSLWPQLLADILERPIGLTADPSAATALGACRIAAQALNWPEPKALAKRIISPRPDRQKRARRLNAAFTEATNFARRIAPMMRSGDAGQ